MSTSSFGRGGRRHGGGHARPRHPDREIDRRIRQLDAEREPLSLPEEIVTASGRNKTPPVADGAAADGNATDTPTTDDVDRNGSEPNSAAADLGEVTSISELQRLSATELAEVARREGVTATSLSKQELVVELLKHRMQRDGLMYGEGTLEILPDGFGFLRSPEYHYLSCPDDIYVSPSQIRRFGLQTGSHVAGQIRPPKENERYFALLRIEAVDRRTPSPKRAKVPFDELTATHPDRRLRLEHDALDLAGRCIDLMTPLGFGSRGLIIAPPRSGATELMRSMAQGITANHPDTFIFVLLVDERPEEVTEMERSVGGERCEVISSTFDEPNARHLAVTQMVLEKAKRMVENRTDVVILLDSITRLTRAWETQLDDEASVKSDGRSGGDAVDAVAMQQVKSIFGSARRIDEGGSLTIVATASTQTGNRTDELICDSLRGTGNTEIVLDASIARRRIHPAIDPFESATRREDALIDDIDADPIATWRDSIADLDARDALRQTLDGLKATRNNREFLDRFAVSDTSN